VLVIKSTMLMIEPRVSVTDSKKHVSGFDRVSAKSRAFLLESTIDRIDSVIDSLGPILSIAGSRTSFVDSITSIVGLQTSIVGSITSIVASQTSIVGPITSIVSLQTSIVRSIVWIVGSNTSISRRPTPPAHYGGLALRPLVAMRYSSV